MYILSRGGAEQPETLGHRWPLIRAWAPSHRDWENLIPARAPQETSRTAGLTGDKVLQQTPRATCRWLGCFGSLVMSDAGGSVRSLAFCGGHGGKPCSKSCIPISRLDEPVTRYRQCTAGQRAGT